MVTIYHFSLILKINKGLPLFFCILFLLISFPLESRSWAFDSRAEFRAGGEHAFESSNDSPFFLVQSHENPQSPMTPDMSQSAPPSQSPQDNPNLEAQVMSLRGDKERLSTNLRGLSRRMQLLETQLSQSEQTLVRLKQRQINVQKSLGRRTIVLSSVLGALQRIGRKLPPALIVYPADVMRAIRTSIVFGAMLPQVKLEVISLVSDLEESQELQRRMNNTQLHIRGTMAQLMETKGRLEKLIGERQKALEILSQNMVSERARTKKIADNTRNLQELVTKVTALPSLKDPLIGGGGGAASEPVGSSQNTLSTLTDNNSNNNSKKPEGIHSRLNLAFTQSKGKLFLPVAGQLIKRYGESDGLGGKENGISLATRFGAVVIAPARGRVVFSGPHRTYGQLLILDAGEGYYVVLAGMARIDVQIGQNISVGEPVGIMATKADKSSQKPYDDTSSPVLYLEFRKDGAPIDPSSWWSKAELKKVHN